MTTAATFTLEDAKTIVQEAPCSPLNSSLEGALVHLTCPVQYAQPLGQNDPLLSGVPQEQRMGVRLEAHMRVFQWDEFPFTKKVGKKNVRDFLYFREWMDRTPPSNTTFFGSGRECKVKNGDQPCYQWIPSEVEPWWNSSGYQLGWNTVETAQNVTVGDYRIPNDALELLEIPDPMVLQPSCSAESRRQLKEQLPCVPGAHLADANTIAWQQFDSNGTWIDYLTRQYQVFPVDTISILAVQRGDSFVPWPEEGAPLLYEFVPTSMSASQMIEAAKSTAAITRSLSSLTLWFAAIGVFLLAAALAH